MDIPIRRAVGDDLPAIAGVDGASFGVTYSSEELADVMALMEAERFLVATDRDRIVGVTGSFPFNMTIPGGALDLPGVSWVSVDVTHRRRGILRELMHRQLQEFREQGQPAAMLMASEGGIYGRFGYGPATQMRKVSIDRRRTRLTRPGDAGAVTRSSAADARRLMPALHERWRAQTPGAVSRSGRWWDYVCLDRESQRGGQSERFYLTHADGFVAYRMKAEWNDGDPRHVCTILEYVITSPKAHADFWQLMLSMDLVATIESYRVPLDDPLPLLVSDPRQVRTLHVGDGLWIRPLDVAAMLSARSYALELDMVIEVTDSMFGDGRYRLQAGPEGARCAPTTSPPDVFMDIAGLGSVYLGGARLHRLAAAGQAGADEEEALVRLDRALLTDREPVLGTAF